MIPPVIIHPSTGFCPCPFCGRTRSRRPGPCKGCGAPLQDRPAPAAHSAKQVAAAMARAFPSSAGAAPKEPPIWTSKTLWGLALALAAVIIHLLHRLLEP